MFGEFQESFSEITLVIILDFLDGLEGSGESQVSVGLPVGLSNPFLLLEFPLSEQFWRDWSWLLWEGVWSILEDLTDSECFILIAISKEEGIISLELDGIVEVELALDFCWAFHDKFWLLDLILEVIHYGQFFNGCLS